MNTHRKGLLDGCDDWVISADLPEWEIHPDVIRKTSLRPDIVTHSASTQQIIMVKLTFPMKAEWKRPIPSMATKLRQNCLFWIENAAYKHVASFSFGRLRLRFNLNNVKFYFHVSIERVEIHYEITQMASTSSNRK
ncbi:reverse transcriptase [Plakobranchus ocellatus]|uniref:Reverse transcriptase n=1 Tax=Plakobranchus ocellatus TaxID=259542 RepID=A0AAV4CNP0_9GAST|nr:reverse transcriptase [Plakobranchus ocellatus]